MFLSEAGSTTTNNYHVSAVGQYAFSFVQLEPNASLVFDYSSTLVPHAVRKKLRPSRPGILLITGVLKVATGGRIHSDGQVCIYSHIALSSLITNYTFLTPLVP